MVSCFTRSKHCRLNRNLHELLLGATDVISYLASNMYSNRMQWQGYSYNNGIYFSRGTCGAEYIMDYCREWLRNHEEAQIGFTQGTCAGDMVNYVREYLRTHEEAQVMLASIMVVVGLWWLVRAVLTLLINLLCPLLFVILAIVCVPQLRAPLLGQNYPLLANLLRNILLKLAENITGQVEGES